MPLVIGSVVISIHAPLKYTPGPNTPSNWSGRATRAVFGLLRSAKVTRVGTSFFRQLEALAGVRQFGHDVFNLDPEQMRRKTPHVVAIAMRSASYLVRSPQVARPDYSARHLIEVGV
jgi:hypothetical protein